MLSEFLYNDLVLMNKIIERIRNIFLKCEKGFSGRGLKVNFWQVKVMVCRGNTKGGLSKSEVDQCGGCSLSKV